LDGGGEWGGPAYDPGNGWLYVNANEMAWEVTMLDVKAPPASPENYLQAGEETLYQSMCCLPWPGQERCGKFSFAIKYTFKIQTRSTITITGNR
jgi:quinoprotein glucose dehydrogenase